LGNRAKVRNREEVLRWVEADGRAIVPVNNIGFYE